MIRSFLIRSLSLTALAALFACSPEPPQGVLLRDVTIVDLESGDLRAGQSIRVAGGRITAIGSTAELGGRASWALFPRPCPGRQKPSIARKSASDQALADQLGKGVVPATTAVARGESYMNVAPIDVEVKVGDDRSVERTGDLPLRILSKLERDDVRPASG